MKVKSVVFKELIRVDKHGNHVYRTNRCKKCGGTGNLGYTIDDGRCWRCMGTGIENEHNVTEYTPEQQILRSAKRTAKRLGTIEQQMRKMGFNIDGFAFIPIGNTFAVKDKIKDAGGVYDKFSPHGWVSPVPLDFIETKRVEAKEVLDFTDYEESGIKWTVVSWKKQQQ